MAIPPQKLPAKASAPLVLDASVVINLIATGFGSAILASLESPAVIVDVVVGEIEAGRSYGRNQADALAALIYEGRLTVVGLAGNDQARFTGLVTGPSSETLDDGEAATIAFAVGGGAIAVIDERKATRISAELFPGLICKNTVDLLSHSSVEARLGRSDLASAVYNALRGARMRVFPDYVNWVVALIGPDRASSCSSLPRSVR